MPDPKCRRLCCGRTALAALAAVVLCHTPAHGGALPGTPVRAGNVTIRADGRAFHVDLVRARLSEVRVRVGIGGGKVGRTESLAGIAAR
jgi:hypothetical protein